MPNVQWYGTQLIKKDLTPEKKDAPAYIVDKRRLGYLRDEMQTFQ